ncbi:virion structural protein [Bacillus phage 0305phi8-36]|uniref:virion structural protein n=1 Tax=Bacillus phage 0305phi8-36 TaxID=458639 RepID=UPI00015A1EFE|nr:virion structural protein [Bacillus phage 0305phi8-36]ABS83710.1 virion structural protein [Bacillus phage 0305phi8-36]
MKDTQLDTRQIQASRDGFKSLHEQLEFGRFNSVKSGAAPTMFQELQATDGQTVFTLPNGTFTVGDHSLQVYANGMLMREGKTNDYIEIDNRTIEFLFPLTSRDIIVFRVAGGTSGPSLSERHQAVANQTDFKLAGSYSTGNDSLIVFVSGAYQTLGEDYIEVDAKTVRFLQPLEEGDLVTFRVEGLPAIESKYKNVHIHRQYDSNKQLIKEEITGDERLSKEYIYDEEGKPKMMITKDSGYTITKTYEWDGFNCINISETVKEGV